MSFIGAVKYRVIHKTVADQTETEYKIDIKESGYSGAVTELVGWGDTFALIYDRINPDQPLANPIQKARFELDIVIREGGPELQLMQLISDADEDEYVIEFYIDDVKEWTGFVMPDLLEYSQGDYPAKARIVAKDFTKLSASIWSLTDTRSSVIGFIASCLADGFFSGLDLYAYTTWDSDEITPSGSFLDAVIIDQKALRIYSTDPDLPDQPFTKDQALTAVLKNFGLILRQAKGAYRLYQLSAFDTVAYVDAHKYNFQGTFQSTTNELITVQPGSDLYVLPSSVNTIFPGIKRATVVWNHRFPDQQITLPERVDIGLLGSTPVPFSFSGQGIIGDDASVVKFSCDFNITSTAAVGGSRQFTNPTGLVEIKIDGATDYYLTNANGGIEWTTTPSNLEIYTGIVGAAIIGSEVQFSEGFINVTSPPITSGIVGTLSITFKLATGGYTGGTNSNQFYSGIKYEYLGYQTIEQTKRIQYVAETDGNFTYQYDHGEVYYGPGPAPASESALRSDANNDSSIIEDWKRIGDVSNDTFFDLLTREILEVQSTARVLQADLLGKYSAHNAFRFEANTFFFLGGSITGAGMVKGEFLSIQVSNVGVITVGQLNFFDDTRFIQGSANFHSTGLNATFDQSQYVAKTDEIMTGTVTEVPVTPVGYVIGKAGDEIAVFNVVSGAVEVFTMAESYIPGADTIQVQSKALSGAVPNGSYVVYTGKRISSYITQTDSAIVLGVRTADLALLSDDSILTNEDGDEYFFTEGDVTSNLIYTEAQINIRADQILAAVSAIVGEDLTVLNDIVADIAELQSKVDTAETDIDTIQSTLLTLPTDVEFTALESQLEINTDSIRLGVRAFSLALFDNNDEFLLSDDSELVFIDTENGDILALIRYNESLINVERDRIDLKVLEIGAGFSLGKLYFTFNSGVSYSTVTFIANNDNQDLSFRNGDVLRITNNAGEQEEVRVSGDQTIPASTGQTVATINIVAKTFQYTHLRLASYVSFPGYATGSEINLLKDEIVLKVNNAGQIASINLDGSAEVGSAITISADQINIEGVVTAINSATAKIDDTQVNGTKAIIYSASEPSVRPSGSALEQGDTWFDTDAGNKPYVYSGSAWIAAYTEIDGGAITTGTVNAARIDVSGVISAGSIIVQSALDSAINTAVEGVTVTIRSDSEPTQRPDTSALQEGDIWIDTNDGNKPYTYSGSAWVAAYTSIDGGNITTGTIDASVVTVSNIDADEITTGTLSADRVDVEGVITVINTATNKIDDNAITGLFGVIYSDTEPTVRDTGTALQQGDTWYDTDDGNKPYVYSGSAWVAAYTAIDGGNITTGTVTASRIDVSGIFAEQISISGTGYIQSTGYSAGSAGFRIEADGDAEFNDVTVRGVIVSGAGSSIDGSHLVADSVTATQIAAGTITATEIAANTITASQIASQTITASEIASDTITAGQIAAGTITATEIASGTITATQIATDTITASQIATGTITATEIASGTITATQIATGTITATQIAAGTITATELAADSVTADKIDVTNLAAVNASTGALTVSGTLTVSTGGKITGSNYEFTDAGGNVAGWDIGTDLLRSATSGARVELNKAKSRVSIFDATSEKVAMGYLEGLDKNSASGSITSSTTTTITDSTKDWATDQLAGLIVKVGNLQRTITSNTATVITCAAFPSAPTGTYSVSFPSNTYGFWAKDGDDLFIDGDVVYESGDWIIRNDGSLKILNGAGQEIIRLGTDTGEKGLFNYDTSGNTLSKFTSTGLVIGDDYTGTDYLEYDQSTGVLTLRGTLNADDITAGTLSADRIASASITADKLSVTSLSAIDTDTGALTVSDTLTMGASGSITNTAGDFTLDEDGLSLVLISGSVQGNEPSAIKWSADVYIAGAEGGVSDDSIIIEAPKINIITNPTSGFGMVVTGSLDVSGQFESQYLTTSASATNITSSEVLVTTLEASGTIQASGYKSSDGSAGYTGTFYAEDGGDTYAVVVKNGLITNVALV